MQNLPRHIAIIMDGNGRWAKARKLKRTDGHIEGVKAVRRTLDAALEAGIKYVTLYTFSEENWSRPQEEVAALMFLLVQTLRKEIPNLIDKKVRLRVIGDLSRLPDSPRQALLDALAETNVPDARYDLILALNYSARTELVHAVNRLVSERPGGPFAPEDIDRNLYAPDIPFPDLLIRTGGELRISNFLLWQLAYAELYFTDTFWPDFGKDDLMKALTDYAGRQRRYGRTGDQVDASSEETK